MKIWIPDLKTVVIVVAVALTLHALLAGGLSTDEPSGYSGYKAERTYP